jgi:chemotaxis protein MotA
VDLATIIGLVLAFGGIFGGMILEGGNPAALLNIPSILIVVVGTIGSTFVSYSLSRMLSMAGVVMKGFFEQSHDPRQTADLLVSMAEQSRREGLLSLESKLGEVHDPFVKKGLMLMVDGTDPERLRTIMEIELAAREERHESGLAVLESMGALSPTLGIIGTVLGLINVLSNLADTSSLGHKIAGAFIATFYGIFMANVFYLPLATKLKAKMKHESHMGEMCLEGILAIQSGDNPRIVREKLNGFLPPKLRSTGEGGGGAGEGVKAAA